MKWRKRPETHSTHDNRSKVQTERKYFTSKTFFLKIGKAYFMQKNRKKKTLSNVSYNPR